MSVENDHFWDALAFCFRHSIVFFSAVAIIPIFVDADLNQKEREMNKRKGFLFNSPSAFEC